VPPANAQALLDLTVHEFVANMHGWNVRMFLERSRAIAWLLP
jgi:hypothetical protein